MRRPRGAALVAEASASIDVEPVAILLKTSSLTAAVNAAVFWYAIAISKTEPSVIGRLDWLSAFFRQRGVEQAPAFGQLAQRSLQFLHVVARETRRHRRRAGRGRCRR